MDNVSLNEAVRNAALTSGGRNQRLKFARLGRPARAVQARHSVLAERLLEVWCLGHSN